MTSNASGAASLRRKISRRLSDKKPTVFNNLAGALLSPNVWLARTPHHGLSYTWLWGIGRCRWDGAFGLLSLSCQAALRRARRRLRGSCAIAFKHSSSLGLSFCRFCLRDVCPRTTRKKIQTLWQLPLRSKSLRWPGICPVIQGSSIRRTSVGFRHLEGCIAFLKGFWGRMISIVGLGCLVLRNAVHSVSGALYEDPLKPRSTRLHQPL